MNLSFENRDLTPQTGVVTLRGRLMLGKECTQLGDFVEGLLNGGRKNLVFDLTGVTQIDSTGLGRFIDAFGHLQKSGGVMRLAGASGPVRDSFRVTRLDTVFSFYPSVDAACEGL